MILVQCDPPPAYLYMHEKSIFEWSCHRMFYINIFVHKGNTTNQFLSQFYKFAWNIFLRLLSQKICIIFKYFMFWSEQQFLLLKRSDVTINKKVFCDVMCVCSFAKKSQKGDARYRHEQKCNIWPPLYVECSKSANKFFM